MKVLVPQLIGRFGNNMMIYAGVRALAEMQGNGFESGDWIGKKIFDLNETPCDENTGCTASHAAVLRLIIKNGWQRTLVFEDDFLFRFDNSQEQFSNMIGEVPPDWFMLYLGGHYAEKPMYRVSPHVIRMGRMKTTSSYGVTLEAAWAMEPSICGIGPIDELYSGFIEVEPCYIFEPRLVVQRAGWSDLQKAYLDYGGSMTDENHVKMLD